MPTSKKSIEIPGAGAGRDRNLHLVFVANESGITSAFESIKSELGSGSGSCLTLIYSTSAYLAQPLYKAELESLERRFPARLIIHYLFSRNACLPDEAEAYQRILEIVINSNTSASMQFLVVGQDEFTVMIAGRLQFLGVTKTQIISNAFKI